MAIELRQRRLIQTDLLAGDYVWLIVRDIGKERFRFYAGAELTAS